MADEETTACATSVPQTPGPPRKFVRQVVFKGSSADLELLGNFLQRIPDVAIEMLGIGACVQHPTITTAADPKTAHRAARALFERASRLYRLYHGTALSGAVGSHVREHLEDGTLRTHHVIVAETGRYSYAGYPVTLTPSGADDPVPNDFRALESSPEIEAAINHLAAEDNTYGFWKAYEEVRRGADGGPGLVARGWATELELNRFHRLGQDQRHYVGASRPNVEPMGTDEAREFVYRLIRSWIKTKS